MLYCRAVDMAGQTEQQRGKRRHQRTLFDSVAQLYEASRLGYPHHIVEFAVATAAAGAVTRRPRCRSERSRAGRSDTADQLLAAVPSACSRNRSEHCPAPR